MRIPRVHVRNDQYRLDGSFHQMSPHSPVRDEDDDWKLLGITNPRDMTYIHSYGGEAEFFDSLSQGKLLTTRCEQEDCRSTGTMYLPFRIHCPDCLGRNAVIDCTEKARDSARIYTYMVCERSGAFSQLDTPITFINISIDGVATILMSYLSVGEPAIGVRVIPIFRSIEPTFTIIDLSWVVEGTTKEQLPGGFSF